MKQQNRHRFVAPLSMLALVLSLTWLWRGGPHRPSELDRPIDHSPHASGSSLSSLLSMADGNLSRVDIGLMNLRCAEGLPTCKASDSRMALLELDRIATRVKAETERHYRKFHSDPKEFNDSEAYFRMLCLVTVLQQDFGVHYNPNRARPSEGPIEPNDAFFADAADIFVHGLVGDQRTGTCSSLPVLYVAVGRRLGYPLKLVAAKNHLFVRWDGERERLNIEATTQGLTTFDDDYYRSWPFPITPEEERTEHYLKSMTATEELAVFLSLRAQCLGVAGRFAEALEIQERTCRLVPQSIEQRKLLDQLRKEFSAEHVTQPQTLQSL